MNSSPTIHLTIESGPDRGREFHVPANGARVGRASGNDIVLTDPSLSRFHCRFYFKDGRDLCVSDLASTNETLINSKPIQDGRLFAGDRITIGETVIKIVNDTVPGAAPSAPAAAVTAVTAPPGAPAPAAVSPAVAAPILAPTVPAEAGDVPAPAPAGGKDIDLGLRRTDGMDRITAPGAAAPARNRLLFVAASAVLLIACVGVALWLIRPNPRAKRAVATGPQTIEIQYEKVEGSAKNVFRYSLSLENGTLAVRVDNLEDGRHMSREKKCDPKMLELLAKSIEESGYFQLDEDYQGLAPEVHDLADLTVTIGRRTHRSRVLNRLQPETFRKVREEIEEFARNEIGLYALALPPEKLVELGRNAWLTGQKLYDEREVRHDNLFRAIKSFSEAEALVDSVEPKPDYYPQAVAAREECKRMQQQKYEDFMFRADRAIKLSDWKEANAYLQVLIETLGDRSDERYEAVNKKLIDVQRRLERK